MRTRANPRGSPRVRLISSLAMLVVVGAGVLFYSLRQTAQLFDTGVVAQVRCMNSAQSLDAQFAPMLQPLQQAAGAGYTISAAHPCHVNGRNYIRILLEGNPAPVSVILTLRRNQEIFPRALAGRIVQASGTTLHETSRGAYSVAAFDSGPWLVYVVSKLPEQQNSGLAARLTPVINLYTRL